MNYDQFHSAAPVSRETFDKFSLYHDLLFHWQKSINLISPTTLESIWERHIIDCAQWLPLYAHYNLPIIDMGSGAGLPGLILSIANLSPVTLVESDQKKGVFLSEVKRQLSLSCDIKINRAQEVDSSGPAVITCRALAPLKMLFELSSHLLCKDSVCLFAKGKNYAKEMEDAEKDWQFTSNVHSSHLHPEGVMLELTHVSRRKKG